jgi:hypothetical protein
MRSCYLDPVDLAGSIRDFLIPFGCGHAALRVGDIV